MSLLFFCQIFSSASSIVMAGIFTSTHVPFSLSLYVTPYFSPKQSFKRKLIFRTPYPCRAFLISCSVSFCICSTFTPGPSSCMVKIISSSSFRARIAMLQLSISLYSAMPWTIAFSTKGCKMMLRQAKPFNSSVTSTFSEI